MTSDHVNLTATGPIIAMRTSTNFTDSLWMFYKQTKQLTKRELSFSIVISITVSQMAEKLELLIL